MRLLASMYSRAARRRPRGSSRRQQAMRARTLSGRYSVNAGSGDFDDAAIETLREAAEAHVT